MHGIFFKPPLEANFIGHQMSEIYKDEIYHPFLAGKKGLTIVDIGANIGLASLHFVKSAKKVYAVEPAHEHFEALTRMIMFNNLQNIIPIKKAVGIKNGEIELFKNRVNVTMFSTDPVIKEFIDKRGEMPSEKVECITLDKLFKENEIEHCDFMKMDVEGSETEILSHTSFKKVAPKIDTIVLESHFWNGRHPNQTVEALKNNGFKVRELKRESESALLVAEK